MVTNVGAAHIENFDSIEGIAAAKRELIEALPPEGTAVLNADDPRVAAFARAHPGRTILYGLSPERRRPRRRRSPPDRKASNFAWERGVSPVPSRGGTGFRICWPASPWRASTASSRAAARTSPEFTPGKMRGERFHPGGILIYNDCYNSNPDAVRAMLDVLHEAPARKRIAVLGEMLELGRWAETLHRDVGNYAARSGLNVLVGIRGAACYMVDAVKRSGLRVDAAFFFEDPGRPAAWCALWRRPATPCCSRVPAACTSSWL